MSSSLAHRLDPLPRKNPARASLRGEGAGQFLSSVNLGHVVDRAIHLAGRTKDQAAQEMGYANASLVSRWIANTEPFNLSRFWAVADFRSALIVALAEDANDAAIEVQRTVIVRKRTA